ncbi:MAG: hypothetical protein EOM91_20945 [Sphingobacteriia bacterium]|nr:hypothetical protein [Sphingobacteriia bacterium]
MATHNEPVWALEGLLHEEPELSREVMTIPTGTAAMPAMSVLGTVRTTEAVGAATTAGNGDFVTKSVGADASAEAGVYILHAISATKALLYSPSGALLGIYTVGDAYDANGIQFDTENTWAANDYATITVTHTDAIGAYNATGPALGVALYPVDASAAAADVTALVRLGAVQSAALQWADGVDAGEKTAAIAQLAANHLIVRS